MAGVLSEADQKEEILRARERDALRRKDNEFVLEFLSLPYHSGVIGIALVDSIARIGPGAQRSAATYPTPSLTHSPRSLPPSAKSCM